MIKKPKRFLGFIPHGVVEKYYDDITEDIEEHCGVLSLARRLPAHITLVQPFVIKDDNQLDAVRHVIQAHTVCNAPFSVDIRGFDWFLGNLKDQTAFLAVEPNARLSVLVRNISLELGVILPDWVRLYSSYHPHVSIARNLSEKKAQEVVLYLASKTPPYFEDVLLNTLTLFVLDNQTQIYRAEEEFLLTGS